MNTFLFMVYFMFGTCVVGYLNRDVPKRKRHAFTIQLFQAVIWPLMIIWELTKKL